MGTYYNGRGTGRGRDEAEREREARHNWKPAFQSQIQKLVSLSLWNILAFLFLGALVGIVAGLALGQVAYNIFFNIGLFDGIKIIPRESRVYIPIYFMAMSSLGMMVAGMGAGMRHAMITGNLAVARAVLTSALEHAIRTARDSLVGRHNTPLSAIYSTDLEVPLKERVDALADHVEGYGIARYFRRYVSAITVDYIEEVVFAIAAKLENNSEDKSLNKDAILSLKETSVLWIKKHAARSTFLVVFMLIVLPVVGTLLFLCFPVFVSSLVAKFTGR